MTKPKVTKTKAFLLFLVTSLLSIIFSVYFLYRFGISIAIVFGSISVHSHNFQDHIINSIFKTVSGYTHDVANLLIFGYLIYEAVAFAYMTTTTFVKTLKYIDFLNKR